MPKDKKRKKKEKKPSRKNNKKTLKVFDKSELDQQASIDQSNANIQFSKSDDCGYRVHLIRPREKKFNTAKRITFDVGPFQDSTFQYNPDRPLMIKWKINILTREIDQAGTEQGSNDTEISLKPELHGCWPWPVTSALGYFTRVRTSYNNVFTNDLELLHAARLDELNTVGSMDAFLNPDEENIAQQQNYGMCPLFSNEGKTANSLKKNLGKIPNLNYPDNAATVLPPTKEGFHWSFGRIPTVPFAKFSPRMRQLMKQSAGNDPREDLDTIIFPPNTALFHDFEKTDNEKYLDEFYWPAYVDSQATNSAAITGGKKSYQRFNSGPTGSIKTYLIKGARIYVDDIVLVGYKKKIQVHSPLNKLGSFNSYFTCRRLQETLLDTNKYPISSVWVDQPSPATAILLTFRRGIELDRDSGSDGHNFSSQTCYRPPNLDEITLLEGSNEGGELKVFNEYRISKLATKALDLSMFKYAEATRFSGWISDKKVRNFWEIPRTESSENGTQNSGDTGNSNYFPFSTLSETVEKNLRVFNVGADKAKLMLLRLGFTSPLTGVWYMVVYSEYLCKLTWTPGSGEPKFSIV